MVTLTSSTSRMPNMQGILVLTLPRRVTKGKISSEQVQCSLHLTHSFFSKSQAPHPGTRTPFDCCALSFQPFTHPVCARNPDGTGHVFDLVNIIPWLKYVVYLLQLLPLITVQGQATQQHPPNH